MAALQTVWLLALSLSAHPAHSCVAVRPTGGSWRTPSRAHIRALAIDNSGTFLDAANKPSLQPRQLDLRRLEQLYDPQRPSGVRAVARELNASSVLVRYWLHRLELPLSPTELKDAEADAMLLTQLEEGFLRERPPSLNSLATGAGLSVGGLQGRLRALLPASELARIRRAPGRPRLEASVQVAADIVASLPNSGWDIANVALATGVSRTEARRTIRDYRLQAGAAREIHPLHAHPQHATCDTTWDDAHAIAFLL